MNNIEQKKIIMSYRVVEKICPLCENLCPNSCVECNGRGKIKYIRFADGTEYKYY